MRHAYLIMAHNELKILKLLLLKLDDKNNDIYIHFDKKNKINKKEIENICKESKIYFTRRINVFWGDFSQIKCEMILLNEAIKGNYDYYHLISGVDLPIKSNVEINAFFEENKDNEFISIDSIGQKTKEYSYRYDRFHFYLNCISKNFIIKFFFKGFNKVLKIYEKIINYIVKDRTKKYKDVVFAKGSAYFDITHEFAEYIVKNKKRIFKMFKFTKCCDEVFMQTFFYNSKFIGKLSTISTRFIDWSKHGSSPEILTLQHYNEIINSNNLFARKFSTEHSRELIEKLFNYKI